MAALGLAQQGRLLVRLGERVELLEGELNAVRLGHDRQAVNYEAAAQMGNMAVHGRSAPLRPFVPHLDNMLDPYHDHAPIIPNVRRSSGIHGTNNALAKLMPAEACAHNPSVYYEHTGLRVPECKLETAPSRASIWPQLAHMLILPGREEQFSKQRKWLHGQNITLRWFPAANGPARFARYLHVVLKGMN